MIHRCKPKLVVMVVYKTQQGDWRGFCSPYDVTCHAETKVLVKERIEKLVALYEEGLKKYNYPENLTLKKLSDKDDQKAFDDVIQIVSEKLKREISRNFMHYQTEVQPKTFSSDSYSGYYYQPVFC